MQALQRLHEQFGKHVLRVRPRGGEPQRWFPLRYERGNRGGGGQRRTAGGGRGRRFRKDARDRHHDAVPEEGGGRREARHGFVRKDLQPFGGEADEDVVGPPPLARRPPRPRFTLRLVQILPDLRDAHEPFGRGPLRRRASRGLFGASAARSPARRAGEGTRGRPRAPGTEGWKARNVRSPPPSYRPPPPTSLGRKRFRPKGILHRPKLHLSTRKDSSKQPRGRSGGRKDGFSTLELRPWARAKRGQDRFGSLIQASWVSRRGMGCISLQGIVCVLARPASPIWQRRLDRTSVGLGSGWLRLLSEHYIFRRSTVQESSESLDQVPTSPYIVVRRTQPRRTEKILKESPGNRPLFMNFRLY